MTKTKIKLSHNQHRALLSDTLPFEVPICFSNRHFYNLVRDLDLALTDGAVEWRSSDATADVAFRLIFNIDPAAPVQTREKAIRGKAVEYRSLKLRDQLPITIPFQFDICHRGNDSRRLTVPHPVSQLSAAAFMNRYDSTIIYHCGSSPISIRSPTSVSRYTYFDDRLHATTLTSGKTSGGVEEHGREYDQIGSYFVYRKYNNIYKFFESSQYHEAEKRFNAMIQLDISRCFDSIYTHSLAWALIGKPAVKAAIGASNLTFAGQFDELIRYLNHNETNGIVIGPEFSRIYAECLLQKIDVVLIREIESIRKLVHNRDFRMFRYLDDYFIFFNEESTYQFIYEHLGQRLSDYKLSLNTSKIKRYDKPIITELTIAKNKVSDVISSNIHAELVELPHQEFEPQSMDNTESIQHSPTSVNSDGDSGTGTSHHVTEKVFTATFHVNGRKAIIAFKTALKESGVSYLEIGNYAFALLEKAIASLVKVYDSATSSVRNEREFVLALIEALNICFFIYAATPRVNLAIRLVRIISDTVESCNHLIMNKDLKHHLFKMVFDNCLHQIRKNRSSDFKEVENLYLLLGLACLGREYWLEESTLAEFLGIEVKEGNYERRKPLNYFSLTSALFYMQGKIRYNKLRDFVISHCLAKLKARQAYRYEDTEIIMLFLDLISCPHITDIAKDELAAIYDLQRADWQGLRDLSKNWFVTWHGLKVGEALDAKRSRDVY